MSKVILALFLVGFWVFLPLPMMFLEVGNYDYVQDSDIDTNVNERPTFLQFIGDMWNYVSIYLKIFGLGISGAPFFINFILLFLKIATVLFLALMLRGN